MIRFEPYELEPTQGLRRDGHEIRLTPRSLAVLWHLAARAGRVVLKDDLFESVWADVAVTDSALATCIQEIRHALDDDARQPRYIETIHRRGYRFVASTQVDGGWELPVPPTPVQQAAPVQLGALSDTCIESVHVNGPGRKLQAVAGRHSLDLDTFTEGGPQSRRVRPQGRHRALGRRS